MVDWNDLEPPRARVGTSFAKRRSIAEALVNTYL
jgi:hypothetical protein